MEENTRFENYIGMIRKMSHKYSKMYNLDYEDVEGRGFEIYLETLESYDPTKGSFSTHLFSNLRKLGHWCRQYIRFNEYSLSDEALDVIESEGEKPTLDNVVSDAKNYLSENAMKVFEWILGRSWERKGVRTPSPYRASKELGISRDEARKVWSEIKTYWNTEGELLYC
jgi:hypothetical protein